MKQQEYIRRDNGDFHQGRDDDMGEEAERQERRGMEDPIWLPEDLEALEGASEKVNLLVTSSPSLSGVHLAPQEASATEGLSVHAPPEGEK